MIKIGKTLFEIFEKMLGGTYFFGWVYIEFGDRLDSGTRAVFACPLNPPSSQMGTHCARRILADHLNSLVFKSKTHSWRTWGFNNWHTVFALGKHSSWRHPHNMNRHCSMGSGNTYLERYQCDVICLLFVHVFFRFASNETKHLSQNNLILNNLLIFIQINI